MTNIEVSFGDSVLRASDVELLSGPFWLNDTIISFYFEYLSLEIFRNHQDKALFVGPEVTHCIKAASEKDLSLFLEPLNAKQKEILFFALNDNKMYGKSGGTHWSLLVYNRRENTMFHFDSMTQSNYWQAATISAKLIPYLSPTRKGDFEEPDCLQQDNGYDCGIFVLCHAEHAMRHFLSSSRSLADCDKIRMESVQSKRHEILNIINNLKINKTNSN